MNDNVKPIRIMALTALVLEAISMLIFFIAHLIPMPFLTLVAPASLREYTGAVMHPLLFVGPLLRLIVIAGFCCMLLRECKKPTSFAPALMILILAATAVLSLILMAVNTLTNLMIGRLYSTETLATVSFLNTAISWTGIITAPVFPLLAAAAGCNWYRYRAMSPADQ